MALTSVLSSIPSIQPGELEMTRLRVRIRFGPARDWRDYAGDQAGEPPGRALYTAVGQGVMREIARLRDAESMAVRGVVREGRSQSS